MEPARSCPVDVGREHLQGKVNFTLARLGEWCARGYIDGAQAVRLRKDLLTRFSAAAPVDPPPPRPAPVPATPPTPSQDAVELEDESMHPGLLSRLLERMAESELARVSSETVMWLLGGLLVLAGSLYFTRSNWGLWSAEFRALVVSAGLVVYASLFLGLSKIVSLRDPARLPGQILGGLVVGLAPISSFATANYLREGGAPILASGLLIAAAGLACLAAFRFESQTRSSIGPWVGVASLISGAAIVMLATLGPAPAVHRMASVAMVALLLLSLTPAAQRGSIELRARLFAWAATAYLALAVVVAWRWAGAPGWSLAPFFALVAVTVHRSMGKNAIASIFVLIAAGVSGITLMGAPLADVPARVIVLVTLSMAAYALLARAVGEERRLLLFCGLTAGLFVYFFIPAPFTAIVEFVLSASKSALGYRNAPLPVGYYGLTFIPYLALVTWFLRRLERAGKRSLKQVGEAWLLVVSGGLLVLSFSSLPDSRPVLFSFPLYGLALGWLARRSSRGWLFHLSLTDFAVALVVGTTPFVPAHHSLHAYAVTFAAFAVLAPVLERLLRGETQLGYSYATVAALLSAGLAAGAGFDNPHPQLGLLLVAASGMVLYAAHRSQDRAIGLLGWGSAAVVPWVVFSAEHPWAILWGTSLVLGVVGCIPLRRMVVEPRRVLGKWWWPAGDDAHRGVLAWSALHLAPWFVLAAAFWLLTSSATPLQWTVTLVLALGSPFSTQVGWWWLLVALCLAPAGQAWLTPANLPPYVGPAVGTALFAVFARRAEIEELTDRNGKRLDGVLRLGTLGLLAATWVFGFEELRGFERTFLILAGATLLAFAAAGLQVLFMVALVMLVLGVEASVLTAGSRLPIEDGVRLVGVMALAFGHGFVTLGGWLRKPAVRTQLSRGFRRAPSPMVPVLLALFVTVLGLVIGLLVILGLSEALEWQDGGWGLMAVWLAARLVDQPLRRGRTLAELVRMGLVAVCGVVLFRVALGPEARPLGLAVALLVSLLHAFVRERPGREGLQHGVTWGGLLAAVLWDGLPPGEGTSTVLAAVIWATATASFVRRPSAERFAAMVPAVLLCVTYLSFSATGFFALPGGFAGRLPEIGLLALALSQLLRFASRQDRPDRMLLWLRGDAAEAETGARLQRSTERWSRILLFAAFLVAIADGVFLRVSVGISHLLLYALFGLVFLASVQAARDTGRVRYAVMAEVLVACMWVKLRTKVGFLAGIPNVDALAMIAGTFLFAGIHGWSRRRQGARAFERASRWTAMLLPIVSLLTIEPEVSYPNAVLTLGAAGTYTLLGRLRMSRWAAPLAAVTFNIAMLMALLHTGASDPQLYTLPLSASILVLSQVYRKDLSSKALGVLRVVALTATYFAGFASVLAFDRPSHALMMATVCVAGVVLGAVLRLRSYLLLGSGFLVVDLAANIVRFGLSGQTAATVVLTGLGLAILAVMVTWSLNRAALEERFRAIAYDLKQWRV